VPNGQKKWSPQIAGSKPIANMNAIDREGLGPYVLEKARENLSCRRISEAIQEEYKIFIGFRSIGFYIETFRDPATGKIIEDSKLPDIPDRLNPAHMARNIHEMLQESEIDDVTALEEIAHSAMGWFRDPGIPTPLKLKVAKELRETIKLKLEIGGVVKPQAPTTNNTLVMGADAMEKMLIKHPEMIPFMREFIYMASGRADVPEKPAEDGPVIDIGNGESA
jgi:hypothetical protein